jgi:UDP-3-O-[3-hydroxymyristoyl] glucosamine N-acyltransferase
VARLLEVSPAPTKDLEVRGVAPLAAAASDQIGFLAHRRYLKAVGASRAGALLVAAPLVEKIARDPRPRLVVPDAHRALATLLVAFHPDEGAGGEIHPTAVLGRGARLGLEVRIGPYAVVEAGAIVGDRVSIGAHSVVGAGARIGDDSVLHPHCVLYPGTLVGARVILHAGVRLGVDGFGYTFQDGTHRKIPQVGRCVIENDVEIGANTTIDRGSIGDTRVGAGSKVDNLVHLGHNVTVGDLSVITAQVGVAGSTEIGKGVQVGGQVGIAGHLTIGDGAKLAGQAGVTRDVPPGEFVMGFPARPRGEFLRAAASQARIPDLIRDVKALRDGPSAGSDGEAEG